MQNSVLTWPVYKKCAVTHAEMLCKVGLNTITPPPFFFWLSQKSVSDVSHMLSSVSENSPLGVIVFLVLLLKHELTWSKKTQEQPWDSLCVLSCLCQTSTVRDKKVEMDHIVLWSDSKNVEDSLLEFTCLWLDLFTAHLHDHTFPCCC